MRIAFKHDLPIEDTMQFEVPYPIELQLDLEYKQELKDRGAKFIYLVDADTNELVAETYFIPLDELKYDESSEHQLEDGLDNWYGKNAIYVYGTTVLPNYQGKGYASLLKAYFYGFLSTQNYELVLGHARISSGSFALNEKFGAKQLEVFENWYETGDPYVLYLKIL